MRALNLAATQLSSHSSSRDVALAVVRSECAAILGSCVEGADDLALTGAQRLLSECRPTSFVEVGDANAVSLVVTFRQHDYRMFDDDSDALPALGDCSFNTLVVPAEKMSDVSGVP